MILRKSCSTYAVYREVSYPNSEVESGNKKLTRNIMFELEEKIDYENKYFLMNILGMNYVVLFDWMTIYAGDLCVMTPHNNGNNSKNPAAETNKIEIELFTIKYKGMKEYPVFIAQ